ncbi:MAG: IS630 family transposase [Methanobacteriota archaeon]
MVLRAELSDEEGNRLHRLMKATRDVVVLRRAMVVMQSAQGYTPPRIAELMGLDVGYVREIVKAFRAGGFDSLNPKWGGGRPRTFTGEVRKELANLATSRPADVGLPFQEWSLSRLRREAIRRGIVDDISTSWLAVILDEAALTYQQAKTWKESKDPRFHGKRGRIERLTRKRHNPPAVVAVDEMGPISLAPTKGRGWHPAGRPHRVRATYTRVAGTRFWFGAYHVAADRLSGLLMERKGGRPWLRFLKYVRRRFPADRRIYVIQDNLSAHWTPDVLAWARGNKVSLVPTATNASWMNPIECRFTEVRSLAFDGSDYRDWREVGRAIRRAVAYRNANRVQVRKNAGLP